MAKILQTLYTPSLFHPSKLNQKGHYAGFYIFIVIFSRAALHGVHMEFYVMTCHRSSKHTAVAMQYMTSFYFNLL